MIAVNACELTALITAAANTLACGLTPEEVGLLGAIFIQLGDSLTTIGLQKSVCKPN